jgi:hypothetical protein
VSTLAVRIDVTTTQVQVIASTTDHATSAGLLITNRGSSAVYLGASGVTAATGYMLDAGQSLAVSEYDSVRDPLFAIAGSGTQVLHVLRAGR